MMVYPAPLLVGDPAAMLYGDAAAWPAPAFMLPPMAFDYTQGMQTYMHNGMLFCAPAADAEDMPAAAPTAASQKKRRRGGQRGGQRGGTQRGSASGSGTQTPSTAACTPPMQSQTDSPKNGILPPPCVTSFFASFAGKDSEELAMIANWGDATVLGQSSERCTQIIAKLDAGGSESRLLFLWFLPAAKTLAFSKHGCRVIQKAIEVVGGNDQSLLVDALKGHIADLYKSPHGNHVVCKMIEVMTPANLGFLLQELKGCAVDVARHQYGCRVLERLIEHCPAEQVAGLVEEVLAGAEALCRHPYGNFVMQHIFEHGLEAWKASITEQITKPDAEGNIPLPFHAKHRTASHVVQRALEFGGPEIQRAMLSVLVNAKGESSLVDVALTRYGSFVVEELAGIKVYSTKLEIAGFGNSVESTMGELAQLKDQVSNLLLEGLPRILDSPYQYGKRAVAKYGILPPGDTKTSNLA